MTKAKATYAASTLNLLTKGMGVPFGWFPAHHHATQASKAALREKGRPAVHRKYRAAREWLKTRESNVLMSP